MQMLVFKSKFLDNRAYVFLSGDKAVLIDTIYDAELKDTLKSYGINELCILLTHEHCDHLLGIEALRSSFKCKVICQEAAAKAIASEKKNLSAYFDFIVLAFEERGQKAEWVSEIEPFTCEADIAFKDTYFLKFAGYIFKCVSTPGHSKGSCCITIQDEQNKVLGVFTGDSLMENYPVHTNLPGGNLKSFLEVTVPFFRSLPVDIMVYPGHGCSSALSQCITKLNNINGKFL